jgi:SAM-dependent methyltransferase
MTLSALAVDTAPLLDLEQWARPVNQAERELLADLVGPVLEIGCGPGRLLAELHRRRIEALGIDAAPAAVARARARGVQVITRSVYDPLPFQGEWSVVLLVDGAIGIGGDPERLLRRVHDLLAPGGLAVVELEPPHVRTRHGLVRLEVATDMVGWFPWCWVGVDEVDELARAADLRVRHCKRVDERWFAHLGRRR